MGKGCAAIPQEVGGLHTKEESRCSRHRRMMAPVVKRVVLRVLLVSGSILLPKGVRKATLVSKVAHQSLIMASATLLGMRSHTSS